MSLNTFFFSPLLGSSTSFSIFSSSLFQPAFWIKNVSYFEHFTFQWCRSSCVLRNARVYSTFDLVIIIASKCVVPISISLDLKEYFAFPRGYLVVPVHILLVKGGDCHQVHSFHQDYVPRYQVALFCIFDYLHQLRILYGFSRGLPCVDKLDPPRPHEV